MALTRIAFVALSLAAGTSHAAGEVLELVHQSLELPGAPAAFVPAELNGDGLSDLVVVLAYSEIESIGVDRIESIGQFSTVIPALFERREARAFAGGVDGSLAPLGAPLPLPISVLSIAAVPGAAPLLLTDTGIATLELDAGPPVALRIRELIRDPPLIAGTRSFLPRLEWVHDLDGDGDLDVLLPAADGLAVYLRDGEKWTTSAAQRLRPPGDRSETAADHVRIYPLPLVGDVDGDGRPDLTFLVGGDGLTRVHVFRGRGDGTFAAVRDAPDDCPQSAGRLILVEGDGAESGDGALEGLSWFGDLDGDGRAEAVSIIEIETDPDGLRDELKRAKRPRQRIEIRPLREDGASLAAAPTRTFEVRGHTGFSVGDVSRTPLFRDLDGDGRLDLVTVTLDFSLFQALRVLTTRRISIGLDFHVWSQRADGSFAEVPQLDLSEKLKLSLNDLTLTRIAQFAGDFDGDGRIDFAHLGRGRVVTIHRGAADCRYASAPDLRIELVEEPQDLGLVRIEDLNGDGRADLAVTRALPASRPDLSPPVVVDLYLSRMDAP